MTASLEDVKFMTVPEVAAVMRVSKMSVYRLIHSGALESKRIGRAFRVPERAVAAYLAGADTAVPVSPSREGVAPMVTAHAGPDRAARVEAALTGRDQAGSAR